MKPTGRSKPGRKNRLVLVSRLTANFVRTVMDMMPVVRETLRPDRNRVFRTCWAIGSYISAAAIGAAASTKLGWQLRATAADPVVTFWCPVLLVASFAVDTVRLHNRIVSAVRALGHCPAVVMTPLLTSSFRCIVPAVSGTQLLVLAGPHWIAVSLFVVNMLLSIAPLGNEVCTQLLTMTVLPPSTCSRLVNNVAPGWNLVFRTVTLVAHLFPLAIMAMLEFLTLLSLVVGWNVAIPRLSVRAMLRLLNVRLMLLATAVLKPPVSMWLSVLISAAPMLTLSNRLVTLVLTHFVLTMMVDPVSFVCLPTVTVRL